MEQTPLTDRPCLENHLRRPSGVLVIDDAGAVRNATRWMLEYYGYKVFTAETGDIALRQFADMVSDIDLVIVDVRLPDMRAGDLIQALKRRKPGVRVVVVSGYDKDELDDSIAPYEFIQKPIRFRDIGETIERMLTTV